MSFNISFNDLVKILKSYDFEDSCVYIIADYLDSCIDYEMDLSYYLWNTALFNIAIIDGDREDAEKYICDELGLLPEDCIIFVSKDFKGVYIEY